MIKNSKLIGTIIRPPTGWKTFKVGELFDIRMSHFQDTSYARRRLPEIKAQSSNHGINTYRTVHPSIPYGLTLGMRGSINCYYQDAFVYLGNNVAGLKLKPRYNIGNSQPIYLYLSRVLFANNYKDASGYSNYPTYHKLMTSDTLELPITVSGQPDFGWMTQYMEAVKQQTLTQHELANATQIKAYLTTSGQDSYEDTVSDREFMRLWQNLPTKTFKLSELFEVHMPQFQNRHYTKQRVPEIKAQSANRGISSYLVTYPSIPYGLTLGMRGSINCYYQDAFVYLGNNVAGLILKDDDTIGNNRLFYLYLSQVLISNNYKDASGYSNYPTYHKLMTSDTLTLPIMNDHAATAEINHFMKLQARPLVDSATACMIGRVQINLSAITYFMNIQTKRMIAAKKQQLDRELEIMKQV